MSQILARDQSGCRICGMTDREEHQGIGRIVSEHRAAKRKYRCRVGKANVMSRRLRHIADALDSIDNGKMPTHEDGKLVVSETENDQRADSRRGTRRVRWCLRSTRQAGSPGRARKSLEID